MTKVSCAKAPRSWLAWKARALGITATSGIRSDLPSRWHVIRSKDLSAISIKQLDNVSDQTRLGRVLINSCADIRFRGIAAQRRRASVFLARYPCECVGARDTKLEVARNGQSGTYASLRVDGVTPVL